MDEGVLEDVVVMVVAMKMMEVGGGEGRSWTRGCVRMSW